MGQPKPAERSVDVCTHSRTFGLAVPVESDGDDELRAAAFLYIDRQHAVYGDRIPWKVLQAFEFNGHRRALITPARDPLDLRNAHVDVHDDVAPTPPRPACR
jgi:hypothetical protein